MIFKPHVYQQHAIQNIINNRASGLFLEMGLGKTIITLTAINELKYNYFNINKVLVIAPKKVAESTWDDEIRKWDHLKHLSYSHILGTETERLRALDSDVDIYIINRDNVTWLVEQYGKYTNKKKKYGFKFVKPWPFDTVIIDELSSFKSPSAKRFKMLRKTYTQTKRIVGLTGTPAPNGLLDLWPQVFLLDEGKRLGLKATAYRDRYFSAEDIVYTPRGPVGTNYKPVPGGEEAIYSAIGDICMSMKAEDWLEMPDRIDRIFSVSLDIKYMNLYKELEKENILMLDPNIVDAGSAAAVSGKLHQMAQGAVYVDSEHNWVEIHNNKLDALDELIEAAQGRPVMVAYWYKHDLERLRSRYPKARTLNNPKDIQDWNRGEIPILLVHPASAGHGLNLQAGGSIIIWFDLTWSLELYQQLNARLYRQGQKQPVIIHHIVVKGTVDEKIMIALQSKANVQNALMDAVKALVLEYNGGN